jgi:uncharacterized protein YcbK (DUF882 family)
MSLFHRPFATRRQFLHRAAGAAAVALPLVAPSARAAASLPAERRLSLVHTHTRERIDLTYAEGGRYVSAALATLERFLRDHYSGAVGRIDPQLYDLLHRVQRELGADERMVEIVSAYRSPATNARLRETRGGGVARHSLHLEGRALDLRLPGVSLEDLRDAARSLAAGGVGYYAREKFVHLDTGRVRTW